MSDCCVFCGAETQGAGLVCPNCQPHIETLPEESRRALERIVADEKALDDMARALQNIAEAVAQAWERVAGVFAEWCDSVAATLRKAIEVWEQWPSITFALAYAWACGAHPEWVKILNRTKKKRTRKKYQDRILRAYLDKEKEG